MICIKRYWYVKDLSGNGLMIEFCEKLQFKKAGSVFWRFFILKEAIRILSEERAELSLIENEARSNHRDFSDFGGATTLI